MAAIRRWDCHELFYQAEQNKLLKNEPLHAHFLPGDAYTCPAGCGHAYGARPKK